MGRTARRSGTAELTAAEEAAVADVLRKTFKRPPSEIDQDGIVRLGPGLYGFVSKRERMEAPLRLPADGAYGLDEED